MTTQPPPEGPAPTPPPEGDERPRAPEVEPITITIDADPGRPRISLVVRAYGDVENDRGWLDYGYALIEEFLRRHATFTKALAAAREAELGVQLAEAVALKREPPAPAPAPAATDGAAQGGNRPDPRRGAPASRNRGGRGGGRGRGGGGGASGSRMQRYGPPIDGWTCDECGGPCGVQPATGRMSSDKVVCLGTCTEGDGYVKTVGWLDD